VSAARWAQQELLDHQSQAPLRVYAVWFNMYPGDAREKWPSTLFNDSRVIQYWDEARTIGTRYLSHLPAMMERRAAATLPPTADAMWDAYFVYAANDQWQEPVPMPVLWGYPIMVTRDQLLRELETLVTK
jgi:hypothetical protein